MNDDLRKRISDALDRPGGIESDAGLVELLAGDPDAAAYARELRRVDRLLRRWPAIDRSDEAWEALAQRIEQRLDEKLATIADPTRPPVFDEERRDPSGAHALDGARDRFRLDKLDDLGTPPAAAPAASRPAPAKAPAASPRPTADDRFSIPDLPPRISRPNIALAPVQLRPEKKSARPWILGAGGATILAAAAAVLLAVVTQQGAQDAAMQSAAPAIAREEASGEASTMPAPMPVLPMLPGSVPAAQSPEQRGAHGGPLAWEPPAAPIAAVPAPVAPAEGYAPPRSGGGGAAIGGAPVANGADGARGLMDSDRFDRPVRARRMVRPEAPAGGGSARSGDPGSGNEGAPAGPRRQPEPQPDPDEALPETPDRGAVRDALLAVTPAVRACAEGQSGVARITITIAGTGRVTNAVVTGQFSGTPQGSCMARAARTARFPRFSQATMQVTYPFQL